MKGNPMIAVVTIPRSINSSMKLMKLMKLKMMEMKIMSYGSEMLQHLLL